MRKKEVTYCKLKKIDIDMFTLDLADLADMDFKGDNLDNIISEFEIKLKQTLDKHAPEVTKKIIERKRQPWFDDSIKTSRHTCVEERCGKSISNHTNGEPLEKHSATTTHHYKPRR